MTRGIALLLTVLTGFSGLVYEVAWQKYLATLLGSHSEATAAVLGIFLGGLSLGYSVFGRATRRRLERAAAAGRPPKLLRFYGVVEAGIGVFALAFPALFWLAQAVSFRVPAGPAGVGFAIDVLLTALLIGPPTVLMGGTIPILTQALARGLADATRFHALVYAFNTVGAFAGALCAGFYLVPVWGLEAVVRGVGLVNLFAGVTFLLLDRSARSAPLEESAPGAAAGAPAGAGAPPAFAAYAAVALLSGFAMMCVQTVLNRIGALAFGASQFTFSMVVAAFVLCIALGSLLVSALSSIRPAYLVVSQWLLVIYLCFLYRSLPDAPYWAHALRALFRDQPEGLYPYHLLAFAGFLAVFAIPIGIAGATLPLLFHHLRKEVADLGGVAGRLYSFNTVGSLLGALLGGYALLVWLDLHHVYRLAVTALAVGAAILSVLALRLPAWAVVAGVVPLLAAVALEPAWDPSRVSRELFRERAPIPATFSGPMRFFATRPARPIPFYDDDPAATVAVLDTRNGEALTDRAILLNGKIDGSLRIDYVTMSLAALLPALFAEQCERAFVIGFGTGVTVGELASLDCTREVVVGEISAAVIRAAPLFDHGNQAASKSPKVRFVRGDAYRTLLRTDGTYDVVASEPSNPWVVGVENLYSREFLEAARSRLSPGGVFAQWIHLYEIDDESVALVLRTYRSVFEQVAVWYGAGPDLLLLGFRDPQRPLDLDRLEQRATRADFAAALHRTGIPGLPALLSHEILPLGVVHALPLPGDVHTLLHPVLSYRAARAFFQGGGASLPRSWSAPASVIGARNSLLGRLRARAGGRLSHPEWSSLAAEPCARGRSCTTLLARWRHEDPASAALAEAIATTRQDPALVAELSELFDLRPLGDRVITPEQAQRATDLFMAYYEHGVPFSPDALQNRWLACRAREGDGRCILGVARASAHFGDLPRARQALAALRDALASGRIGNVSGREIANLEMLLARHAGPAGAR
jgi:spermidine synthase